ncbi:MAG: AEC family transporter [Pseudomonadota bacterium]
MDVLETVLLPLFGAIGVGVLAGRLKLFTEDEVRVFSRFVFQLAMPIGVFAFMHTATPPGLAYAGLVMGYLAGLIAVVTLGLVFTRRVGGLTMNEAGAAVFAVACGNAVFFGLPIALAIPGWATPFLVLMVFEGSFAYAIGHALITWPTNEREEGAPGVQAWQSLRQACVRSLTNPIVLAVLLGMVVSSLGIRLPDGVGDAVGFFGQTASPMGLFVLGIYLTQLRSDDAVAHWKMLSLLVPLKLLVFPLVTGLMTYGLTQDSQLALVGAFITSMPPAVSAMVMASTYRQWEAGTAALVGVGTILGLGTVTLFLAIVL